MNFAALALALFLPPCFTDGEAPSDVRAQWTRRPRALVVSWTNNAPRAAGTRIYRFEVVDGGGTIPDGVEELAPGVDRFRDRRARRDGLYYYKVVAFDECGETGFFDCYSEPLD